MPRSRMLILPRSLNITALLRKIVKKNYYLALIRDLNIDLVPTRLNYSINFDRFYSQNTLRNNDPSNIIAIPTTYNKTFNITTVYGLGWNLTKSLMLDSRRNQPGNG